MDNRKFAFNKPSISPIRILICDNHKLVRDGLFFQLAQNERCELVGMLQDGAELVDYFSTQKKQDCQALDVLLLDYKFPERPGSPHSFDVLLFVKQLHSQCPALKIVFVSMFDQPALVQSALKSGASGFFTKDDSEAMDNLPALICKIVDTGQVLISPGVDQAYKLDKVNLEFSPMQELILSLLLAEPSLNSVGLANRLYVANSTVRNHLSCIYRRLKVSSRTEAVLLLKRLGWQPRQSQSDQTELQV